MMDSLSSRIDAALQAIASAATLEALDAERVAVVGKSGFVTEQLKQLGRLPAEERKAAGERINVAKNTVLEAIAARRNALDEAAFEARLANDRVDVTLPGRGVRQGGLHPVSRTLERIEALFRSIGFEVADGPEIETDFHNFTALNTPENHPARSMHATLH